MKNSFKKSKKNLLALCLSVLMVASGAAAFTACSDKDADTSVSSSEESSSESSSTTVKDDYPIKNASFHIDEAADLTPIVTSVTNWTRSVNSVASGSALSSKAASGIIDTSDEAWKNLTTSFKDVSGMSVEQAAANWDKLSVKDKLAYYDKWKKDNDGSISEDLDFYESFNIDSEDIPTCANPGTPKTGKENQDTNVLMIHNQYPAKDSSSATYKALGTAQKYTSSSTVTVKAGTASEFSVWVRTQELTCSDTAGNIQAAIGKGAYISVTQSVGSKSLPVFTVENINTEYIKKGTVADSDIDLDEDGKNAWVKYSFYLKGSSYADTTYSIVLGLGQGGGEDRGDYVNGYAFFDEITCESISLADYDEYKAANIFNKVSSFDDEKEDKTVDISDDISFTRFAMDYYGDFRSVDLLGSLQGAADANKHIKATSSKYKGENEVTSLKGSNPLPALDGGLNGDYDITKVYGDIAAIQAETGANTYLKAVYDDYFKDTDFAKNDKILMLLSANGVAYTADTEKNADTGLGYTFTQKDFLDDNGTPADDTDDTYSDYVALSFFVKTSAMDGFTGAGVTLKDGKNKTSFVSLDTSEIEAVEIKENDDLYDGWQQCFFFVKNEFAKKDEVSFSLSFTFGPTTITGTTKDDYYAGFAAFTNFAVYPMSKSEYDSVSAGTYAKTVSVTGTTEEKASGSAGFDSAANVPTNALKTGLANPMNYKGVYSDNYYVNQTGGTTKEINLHANAGLINKDYFIGTDDDESYYDSASDLVWMKGMSQKTNGATAEEVWNKFFGDPRGIVNATQPLLIWNDGLKVGAQEKATAYGYIGASTTIAANSYAKVSLAVKVGALDGVDTKNLAANIYLIDMSDTSYNKTMSIGRQLTYWYDDNGNICTGDPAKKATEIAFKLQSNGLYKANEHWSGYSSLTEYQQRSYFANLENYEKDPVTKNLLVAEGGASHAYSDAYDNEGENGIAFYYKESNKCYYAEKELKTPVLALKAVTKTAEEDDKHPLPYRYLAESAKELKATVSYTGDEWAHVSFYIHTGSEAKNYRLEVWSGDRNGAANPANSYVVFDTNYTGDVESNFSTLIEDYKDAENATTFEGVFSYFDSAKFLRYNADWDENKVGNVYKDNYVPSAQTAGVAFLDCTEGNERRIFADYSYSEVTVEATVTNDETEDDKTEETEKPESEMNWWLLASSIAVALVLVLAVVSIIVRKILAKTKKVRKIKVPKATKKAKTVKTKKVEKDDEDSPYND